MNNTTPCRPIGVDGGQYLGVSIRKCPMCGEVKPLTEYGKFHRGPGGYNHKCKSCCRAQGKGWRDANKGKEAQRCAEWRKANPEKRKVICDTWRRENKEAIAESAKAYQKKNSRAISEYSKRRYETHRVEMAEASKAWAEKNPEKVREKGRAWRRRNPDKINAKCSRRRARLGAVSWADPRKISKIYKSARDVSKSTGVEHQVDHVYPLNGVSVSGLHVPENLMVVDTLTNRSKHNKMPGHLAHELWDPEGPDVYYPKEQHA